MNILYILIPLALLLGVFFVASFIWATSKGQFDDLDTPAARVLFDDDININSEVQSNGSQNKKRKET